PFVHVGPDSRNWVNSLYGMTEKPIDDLVVLARSWTQAPDLKVVSGNIKNLGYDMSQRSYKLENISSEVPQELEFLLCADEISPLMNACLYIKGWGDAGVELTVDGQNLVPGKDMELGYVRTITDSDLVVWITKTSNRPVRISLKPTAIPN
ncbi:unnamed protein product, partial [marine sediment metagenome]